MPCVVVCYMSRAVCSVLLFVGVWLLFVVCFLVARCYHVSVCACCWLFAVCCILLVVCCCLLVGLSVVAAIWQQSFVVLRCLLFAVLLCVICRVLFARCCYLLVFGCCLSCAVWRDLLFDVVCCVSLFVEVFAVCSLMLVV